MYRKNGSSSLTMTSILTPAATIGDLSHSGSYRCETFSTLEWQRKETSVPSLYIGRIRFAASTKVSFRLVQSVSIR